MLGPVEHREQIVERETVQRALTTHRASRHFRNFWRYFPDDFDSFAELIRSTWPGMEVQKPEVVDLDHLAMFCNEDRVARELYWSGFGFQVWCQLMTHIVRGKNTSLLIIDEPEIYLHPDLQRRLLTILKEAGPDIMLATHSTEIVSEADSTDLLLINKSHLSAQRLRDTSQVQQALTLLGSGQNLTLTQLARTRRVLFVEGEDFRIISTFAQQLNYVEVAAKTNFAVVSTEGLSNWSDVKGLAQGIEKTLGTSLISGAIFGRDYRCDEDVDTKVASLRQHLTSAYVHRWKEIENYLLVPPVLDRAIQQRLADVARRKMQAPAQAMPATIILDGITEAMKGELQARYIDIRLDFFKGVKERRATITKEALMIFDQKWANLERRMEIVAGKRVFSQLNVYLEKNYGISLTPLAVVREFRKEEVPTDIINLMRQLERFQQLQLSQ